MGSNAGHGGMWHDISRSPERSKSRPQSHPMIARTAKSLGQLILDQLLRTRRAGLREKTARAAFLACRRLVSFVADPIVAFRLAGTLLQLPLSHDLPVIRARYPEYA